MGKVYRRSWVWHFDQPQEKIWPVFADTARFNEAAGTPPYRMEEIPRPDGSVLRIARARIGRMELEWEERPYEWARNKYFSQRRLFRKGPFKTFGPSLTLEAEGQGCKATYTLEGEPANLIGTILLRFGFLDRAGKLIERLALDAAAFAGGSRTRPFDVAPKLPEGAKERVAGMVAAIDTTPFGHGLSLRLADRLLTAQEVDLVRIRPLTLARIWQVSAREVIELCLVAVKVGMLELRWDLLCPRCRGAKESAATLAGLPTGAHCQSCNVDYEREFDHNVEITFRPSPQVRSLSHGEFCLSGPMTTPHVMLQQILAPGQKRTVSAELGHGDYRLRLLGPSTASDIFFGTDGFPTIIADPQRILCGVPAMPGFVNIENRTEREATIVVESRDWVIEALTAHRVTALQAFREQFSAEILRPGDEVAISHITLMFTDLQGSTALYTRIGDAGAYHLVREHFAFLAEAVRANNGAVVKTIGDAVMAAFVQPADALRAAIDVQRNVARFNAANAAAHGAETIVIKVGLHGGSCIAVTLNDRMDYFGSTVNLAARLQSESRGGEIVMSASLAKDPAVAALMVGLPPMEQTIRIKGIDELVTFVRLTEQALRKAPA